MFVYFGQSRIWQSSRQRLTNTAYLKTAEENLIILSITEAESDDYFYKVSVDLDV